MIRILTSDFKFYKANSLSKSVFAVMINPCFWSVVLYRISHSLYNKKFRMIPKLIWLVNRIINSIDLDYRAEIGEKFMIIHGIGIVIGHEVRIGTGVKIYQGVTLGGNNGKSREYVNDIISQPVVLDNVIIAPNAIILGPVIIGDSAVVGAGTVVTKDIPRNSVCYSDRTLYIKEKV